MTITELVPAIHPKDLETAVQAYLDIWNHSDNHPFLTLTGQSFTEAQVRDWCDRHVDAGVRYFAAVTQNEKIAGLLLTRAHAVEGFELFSIGIAPVQKRQGIATQLVLHGIGIAEGQAYRAVDCQVYANNAPMLRLLLNFNFLPVRLEHHRGPRGEDLVHLKKYL